ncbi:MAG TPA: large-conductance mechanosensitive channel protein MscL, partial [Caldilinea sp.]|nr:large-conductance mechanosensitive channel protein MscL [Caldilinea sp.]
INAKLNREAAMWKEFKNFISRGNVLDLAVAVVMGTAFSAIVNSFVNDVIMPIVGVLLGGLDFTGLAITVGESQILYGNFIQAIINFLIIAISMFFVVKGANSMVKKQEAAPAPPPEPTAEEKLLTQIRDILQEQAGTGR